MSQTKERLRAALSVMRRTGKRDLGLHLFMIVFCLIVLAIGLPLIWLLQFLPDWAWYLLGIAFLIWLLFGDTIAAGYRTYRGDQP
ncbi:hypothetical protein NJF44_01115 [Pseudomonas guariconensis]|uniref:hypothetical protein n=1 Tax=Pseudomonas TaxID=286 RepID=UPI0020971707|nr:MULTISPECIES: hypothetical protein [Pseudomonas]MCO7513757.1 hypothetical protein [Pseudomonas putida]MCO7603842.1 hypothetical protein [Pseudomonas guariconensis]